MPQVLSPNWTIGRSYRRIRSSPFLKKAVGRSSFPVRGIRTVGRRTACTMPCSADRPRPCSRPGTWMTGEYIGPFMTKELPDADLLSQTPTTFHQHDIRRSMMWHLYCIAKTKRHPVPGNSINSRAGIVRIESLHRNRMQHKTLGFPQCTASSIRNSHTNVPHQLSSARHRESSTWDIDPDTCHTCCRARI